MMKEVGLQPDDGEGNETGRYVSHKVIAGGRFAVAFEAFEKKHDVNLLGTMPNVKKPKGKTSKFKFECPHCGQNAWAKESASLVCGDCEQQMEAA